MRLSPAELARKKMGRPIGGSRSTEARGGTPRAADQLQLRHVLEMQTASEEERRAAHGSFCANEVRPPRVDITSLPGTLGTETHMQIGQIVVPHMRPDSEVPYDCYLSGPVVDRWWLSFPFLPSRRRGGNASSIYDRPRRDSNRTRPAPRGSDGYRRLSATLSVEKTWESLGNFGKLSCKR